jgi:hypothetical protein
MTILCFKNMDSIEIARRHVCKGCVGADSVIICMYHPVPTDGRFSESNHEKGADHRQDHTHILQK